MTSLREEIATLVRRTDAEITCDSVMRYGTRITGADDTADKILKAIKAALLSEEAVMAGARALTGAKWDNGHKIVSGVKLSAKEMAATEARAALTAALEVVERADG